MENNFTDLMRIFAKLNNNNNQFSERLLMTTRNETQQEKTKAPCQWTSPWQGYSATATYQSPGRCACFFRNTIISFFLSTTNFLLTKRRGTSPELIPLKLLSLAGRATWCCSHNV